MRGSKRSCVYVLIEGHEPWHFFFKRVIITQKLKIATFTLSLKNFRGDRSLESLSLFGLDLPLSRACVGREDLCTKEKELSSNGSHHAIKLKALE
jgi:hypothetical protein